MTPACRGALPRPPSLTHFVIALLNNSCPLPFCHFIRCRWLTFLILNHAVWHIFLLDRCGSIMTNLPTALPDECDSFSQIETVWPRTLEEYENVSRLFHLPAPVRCWVAWLTDHYHASLGPSIRGGLWHRQVPLSIRLRDNCRARRYHLHVATESISII